MEKVLCKLREKKNIFRTRESRIFFYAVFFRLGIYFLSVCMMALFGEYQSGITFDDFLEAWKRWDSVHYINIAQNGYQGAVENGQHLFLVFFPLYPWLMRAFALTGMDLRMAGIIISTVSYGVGSIYFDKVVCMEFDEKISENAALALAVFPFSFFFGAILTESLFFAVTTAFFYYLRKHDYLKVAMFGFLACLTRMQGALLILAVIAELFSSFHFLTLFLQKKWQEIWKKIIVPGIKCMPMILGIFIYLLINYEVEGDPFRFMYYQQNHWNHTIGTVWNCLSYIKENAVNSWYTSLGMSIWIPQLILFFVYMLALIYGIRKRLPLTYMTYLLSSFILTYSSTWLISGGRYTLTVFPMFMLEGKFLTEHQGCKNLILLLSMGLMMIYMIGYYQWKQIM